MGQQYWRQTSRHHSSSETEAARVQFTFQASWRSLLQSFHFAFEEFASCLGTSCFFMSQDDKCRVPIGLTACNKQSPLLMHLDYQVCLQDHDWVVAERHKLIPSVYAAVESFAIFCWTVRSRRKRWVPLSSLRMTCTVRLSSHSLLNDVVQCVAYIYHASVKSAVNYANVHRRSSLSAVLLQDEKKRPVRVAARRHWEMMVILRDHLNNESAEWLDVDVIDLDHQRQQQTT